MFIRPQRSDLTSAQPTLHFLFFGSIEIWRGSEPVVLRRKVRALLAFLAATGRLHSRSTLADIFCSAAADPAAALRMLLTRLRRQLGSEILVTEDDRVGFARSIASIDLYEFERLLAGNTEQLTFEQLAAVAQLYRGPFLADMQLTDAPEFDLWLLGERARLQRLYEQVLELLVDHAGTAQRPAQALDYAQKLVQANPLREESHARLVQLYAQIGQRDAALQQFEHCRQILQRELAVEPTLEMQQLFAAVASGRLTPGHNAPPPLVETTAVRNFAGRDTELAELNLLWNAARQGQGHVVLVEAVAGGGKSRLLAELARSTGAPLLRGTCSELARALPYAPWIDVIEQRLAMDDPAVLDKLAPVWTAYLLRLVPGLAARLGQAAPAVPPTTGSELERLFTAVGEFLFHLPQTPPLIVCIEDLHWADEATLRLFHALASRIERCAALLIGTLRPEEVREQPLLPSLVDGLTPRGLRRLRLPPLDSAAVVDLSQTLWPALSVAARTAAAERIVQATGGNPLYIVEMLRELAGHAAPPSFLPLPASIRELINRRLDRLVAGWRQVIETLAILDSPSTPDQIGRISARSAEETMAALDAGVRLGLLREPGEDQPWRYDVAHDIIRAAINMSMTAARRLLLHRRIAQDLVGQIALYPGLAGRIVRHAIAGDDPALVFNWALEAAEQARAVYAYAEALAFLKAGLTAYNRLPARRNRRVARRQTELILRQVLVHEMLGSPAQRMVALLESARAQLDQVPDVRLEALYQLAMAITLDLQGRFQEITTVAAQGYDLAQHSGEREIAARCLTMAGNAALTLGHNRDAAERYGRALLIWQELGHAGGESICLRGVAGAEWNMGHVQAAIDRMEQALAIERLRHDPLSQCRLCYGLAVTWNYFYYTRCSRAYATEAAELAAQLGYTQERVRARLFIGTAYEADGDPATAEQLYLECWQTAHDLDDVWLAGWAAQLLGRRALAANNLVQAERWLHRAFDMRLRTGQLQNQVNDLAWLGRLCVARGEAEAALEHTTTAIERLTAAKEVYIFETPDIYLAHAEALFAAGNRIAATSMRQQAQTALDDFARQIRDTAAQAAFYRGLVAQRVRAFAARLDAVGSDTDRV